MDSTSSITCFSLEQDTKQADPSEVISFGIEIDEIDVDSKQKGDIAFRWVGRITFVNDLHMIRFWLKIDSCWNQQMRVLYIDKKHSHWCLKDEIQLGNW